jgi:hypothetical protein
MYFLINFIVTNFFFFFKDESVESELSKSIAKVNIFLTDLNDNAPKFLQDSYEYELKDIHMNSFLWLNATDPDEGVNAKFDFGLHGVTRVSIARTNSPGGKPASDAGKDG